MSVYTHLNANDIHGLLSRYDIGDLDSFKGIEGGVENTNYFVTTRTDEQQRRYVLTLFEYLPAATLPFFIDFTDELSRGGLAVPAPVRDMQGEALHTLKNKPCLLTPCFPGKHPSRLTADHCQQVGHLLAQIHTIGQQSQLHQENQRGTTWLSQQVKRLEKLLPPDEASFMSSQWQQIVKELGSFTNLPGGLIHGDLFHDNVLIKNGKITGVIDFYNACHDFLLYDLAVTVNDWCIQPDLELDPDRLQALITAYAAVRPFTDQEKQAWPLILRLASFRFWISRLITFVHPEQEADSAHQQSLVRNYKDPAEFRDILQLRTRNPLPPLT
ncbi:MAG: homoserine kinase [Endozoicomonas sp.]